MTIKMHFKSLLKLYCVIGGMLLRRRILCYYYKSIMLMTKVKLRNFKQFDAYHYKNWDKYCKLKSFLVFLKYYFKRRGDVLVYYGTSGNPLGFITVEHLSYNKVVIYDLHCFITYCRYDELLPILLYTGFEIDECFNVSVYTDNDYCIEKAIDLGMLKSEQNNVTFCFKLKSSYSPYPVEYDCKE